MRTSEKSIGKQLLLAAVFAIFAGILLEQSTPSQSSLQSGLLTIIRFIGKDIFLASLKMVVIPLIFASITSALISSADGSNLKKCATIGSIYYVSTMLMAVCLGLFLVNIINPGTLGSELTNSPTSGSVQLATSEVSAGDALLTLAQSFIPTNVVSAFAQSQVLSIVVFSIILGIGIRFTTPKPKNLESLLTDLCNVFTTITEYIIKLSPIGVFCLLTDAIASLGIKTLGETVLWYSLTVCTGLFIHALIVLPLVAYLTTRCNPYRYLAQVKAALSMAFSTSSSSATLPVSIKESIDKGGVDEQTAKFILPLGATINMDGTALYEAVAVVFLAQMAGIELSIIQMGIIAFTATLAAIGAAGIPSAGLVTMVLVVEAVNSSLPVDSLIPLTGMSLILAIDRPLDMLRTTVNVWGDLLGAKIVSLKMSLD